MSFWEGLLKLLQALFSPVSAKPIPAPEPEPTPKPTPKPSPLDWFVKRDQWGEHNPDNVRELSKGWVLTKYCKSYKTIIGPAYAWCGMILATAMRDCGFTYPVQCESADKWIGHGSPVNWKRDGIPRGAIVVVKGDSYHVALCDEYAPPGASGVWLRGGNQDNRIKRKWDERTVVWVGIPV